MTIPILTRNGRRSFAADDDESFQQVDLPVRFPRFLTAVHSRRRTVAEDQKHYRHREGVIRATTTQRHLRLLLGLAPGLLGGSPFGIAMEARSSGVGLTKHLQFVLGA
jgi:hypothetical protein